MKYKYRLGNFCSVHNETQIILNATKDSVRESCAQLIYFYAASLVKPREMQMEHRKLAIELKV